jgi:predicted PurR-regulated permease PerM
MTVTLHTYTGRAVQGVLVVALSAVLLAILWIALYGILVIFAGMLFGIFLNRLARLLSDYTQLNYSKAFAVVVTILLSIMGVTLYAMGNQIVERADEFIEQFTKAKNDVLARVENNRWWNNLKEYLPLKGNTTPKAAISTATSAVSGIFGVLGGGLLVLFLGFYFAMEPEKYRDGILLLHPPESADRSRQVMARCVDDLWQWILGRLAGMAVIGVTTAVGLWFIGIPLPLTLAFLAGMLNFIPNIGPLISVIPALLFALQQGGNAPFYVAGLYLMLQFVESYLLTPLIDKHQVSLLPGLTLSVQLLFGIVAGFLGLVLATPLALVVVTLVKKLYVSRDATNGEIEFGGS